MKEFFIKGNCPSLKNSKIKTKRGVFPSKTVTKYLNNLGIRYYSVAKKIVQEYKTKPNLFKESLCEFPKLKEEDYPIKLGIHFIRNSKRSFDFNNANQIILDLLTAHDFIKDDSMDYLIPFPLEINGKFYSIDKDNPGTILRILN